jgi:hypothetical protein
MLKVHALPLIDWQQHQQRSNWICLSNFLFANEIRYLLAIDCKISTILFEVFRKYSLFFILFDSYSIMENCLLFTFPTMNSTEGWNIWWSTWPNKLCNYPLVFCVFLFCFVLCTQTSLSFFLVISSVCMQISYYKLFDEAEGKILGKHYYLFGEILNYRGDGCVDLMKCFLIKLCISKLLVWCWTLLELGWITCFLSSIIVEYLNYSWKWKFCVIVTAFVRLLINIVNAWNARSFDIWRHTVSKWNAAVFGTFY